MKCNRGAAGILAVVMILSLSLNVQVAAASTKSDKVPVEAGEVTIESMSGDDYENSGFFQIGDRVRVTWSGFKESLPDTAKEQKYACFCHVSLFEEYGKPYVQYNYKYGMKRFEGDKVVFEDIDIDELSHSDHVVSFSGNSMEGEEGNGYKKLEFKVDRGLPVLRELTADYQRNEYGAVSGAVIHADAFDGASGLSSSAYSIDGGATWQESPDFPVYQNGTYTITVRDKVHFTASKDITVEGIDGTGPVVTEITRKCIGGRNGFSKEVEISVTAEDEGSGLAAEPYSFDGGKTFSRQNRTTVNRNGNVTVVVKDGAGNRTSVQTEVVEIDETGPVLHNVRIVPIDGKDGYGTKADVFFEAEDAGCGLADHPISFDGGQSFTSKMENRYTENGIYKVLMKDALDNLSEGSFQIRCIDKEPPVIELREQSGSVSVNGFYKDVTVKVVAVDEGIGLAQKPYSYDQGTTWTDLSEKKMEKNGKVEVWVRDALMNTARSELEISNLDGKKPVIRKVGKELLNSNGKFGTGAVITVDASDDLSGLDDKAYSFDGGAVFVSENRVSVSENGNMEIAVRDRAGNCARTAVRITEIDRTGPVLEKIRITPVDEMNGYGTKADVSIEISDAGAGIARYPVSFDEGQSFTAKTEKRYTENGTYRILLKDALGNTTEESFEIECIDRQAPEAEIIRNPDSVSVNGFYREDTIRIKASDRGCGLAQKPYSFDRGTTWTDSPDRKLQRNGKTEVWVRDALMNIAKCELDVTDIDGEGPVVGKIEKELLNQSGDFGTEMVITVHAADAGAGLDEKPFSFDGGVTYSDSAVLHVKENSTVPLVIRDRLMNETCREIKVSEIDNTAPSGSISGNPKEKVKKNVILTFTGRDNESGIAALWYQSDRVKIRRLLGMYDGEKTVKEKATITANGNYRFIVRDMVGNEAEYTVNVTKINKGGAGDGSESPDSPGSFDGSDGSGGSNGSGSGGNQGDNGDTVIIGDSRPSDEDGASSGNHTVYPSERVDLTEQEDGSTEENRKRKGGKTKVVKLSGNEADGLSGDGSDREKSAKGGENSKGNSGYKASKETIESLLKENMSESETVEAEPGSMTVYPDIVEENGVDGKKIAAVTLGIILFLCAAAFGIFWYMGLIPLGKKKEEEEEES